MLMYRARAVALAMLFGLFLNGCPLIEEIEELQGKKAGPCDEGRETDAYFADAVRYDDTRGQWIFHNWLGSGPNGSCDIYINIKDGQLSAGPDITPAFVRQAISASVERWANLIRQMGIACVTHVLSEAQGDSLTTRSPRIDVQFVPAINTSGTGGRAEIEYSDASETFSLLRVTLATMFVYGTDTVPMTKTSMAPVVMHELGHVLGVMGFGGASGHSTQPKDVMYSNPACVELSSGDVETFRRIYTENAYYDPGSMPTTAAQKIHVDACCGIQ